MEYEIDTELEPMAEDAGELGDDGTDSELEPNSAKPSGNKISETATDTPSTVRPQASPRHERDAQQAVLIPEEEQQR